jgi:hypothetical protein
MGALRRLRISLLIARRFQSAAPRLSPWRAQEHGKSQLSAVDWILRFAREIAPIAFTAPRPQIGRVKVHEALRRHKIAQNSSPQVRSTVLG